MNGHHKSYGDWDVSFWLNGDEALCRLVQDALAVSETKREAADIIFRTLQQFGETQTPDGVTYTVTNIEKALPSNVGKGGNKMEIMKVIEAIEDRISEECATLEALAAKLKNQSILRVTYNTELGIYFVDFLETSVCGETIEDVVGDLTRTLKQRGKR